MPLPQDLILSHPPNTTALPVFSTNPEIPAADTTMPGEYRLQSPHCATYKGMRAPFSFQAFCETIPPDNKPQKREAPLAASIS